MRSTMEAFLHNTAGDTVAFAPAMEPLAARVGGITYQTMTSDPAQWSSALNKTGQLLKVDALLLGFDGAFVAEACGADLQWCEDLPVVAGTGPLPPANEAISGRLQAAVEALGRLCQTSRGEFCCIATMTGPVTLAKQLDMAADKSGELKQITVEIAQTLCGKRPDLILFKEGSAICTDDIGMTQRKAFNTLRNVAKYFNIPSALYLEGYTVKTLATVDNLKMDFYIFGATAEGDIPDPELFLPLARSASGIGLALPFNDVTDALGHAQRCRKILAGKNLLFTSMGNLAYDTDLEMMLAITAGLRSLC